VSNPGKHPSGILTSGGFLPSAGPVRQRRGAGFLEEPFASGAQMRWMMIALLVSLTALLLAVAGAAHHIWSRRTRARNKPLGTLGIARNTNGNLAAVEPAAEKPGTEEPELESEP
jgi:hypothetical protein